MRLLMVNPNTSQSFTDLIAKIADEYKNDNTEVIAKSPKEGPRSIESIYDELLSSKGTLELVIEEMEDYDGFILACYSDHPVIYALREITNKPVLGIAEASMYMACMLGYKFSIVTTNEEWQPLLWDAVKHYGLESRCASVCTTGMAVLALENSEGDQSYQSIKEAALRALNEDGAEVICLGCAGMAGLDKRLETDINVPVVDGVVAALKFIESLAVYGVSTSKRLAYATPKVKALDGLSPTFAKGYQSSKE